MTLLSVRREVGEFRKRYKWMALFVMVSMLAVIGRLVHLQLVEHDRWAIEAAQEHHQARAPARDARPDPRPQGPRRGENRPAYNLYMTPQLLDREHRRRDRAS